MKFFLSLLLLASIAVNVWQYQHTSEVEEVLSLQKTTATKQKRLMEQLAKELAVEKQNSARTVKSAQGLLDRSERLMHEADRLAAENATYRQRLEGAETSAKLPPPPTPTPTPLPTATPTPTPNPANAKKKR